MYKEFVCRHFIQLHMQITQYNELLLFYIGENCYRNIEQTDHYAELN